MVAVLEMALQGLQGRSFCWFGHDRDSLGWARQGYLFVGALQEKILGGIPYLVLWNGARPGHSVGFFAGAFWVYRYGILCRILLGWALGGMGRTPGAHLAGAKSCAKVHAVEVIGPKPCLLLASVRSESSQGKEQLHILHCLEIGRIRDIQNGEAGGNTRWRARGHGSQLAVPAASPADQDARSAKVRYHGMRLPLSFPASKFNCVCVIMGRGGGRATGVGIRVCFAGMFRGMFRVCFAAS